MYYSSNEKLMYHHSPLFYGMKVCFLRLATKCHHTLVSYVNDLLPPVKGFQ